MGSKKPLRLLVPDVPSRQALSPYLDRIDAARWYSNFGPLVSELESRFAARFRADAQAALHLTTLSNCTLALELALSALRLRPGARVLVPALTFVATATAVRRAGCEVVVADVDQDSWLLTPQIAGQALKGSRIDAVLPVCTYGSPHDAAAWGRFSRDARIPVLIDAAGAFGNQRAGEAISVVFSLHATKSLSAAEGGLLVSHDRALVAAVRRLSNFGIDFESGLVEVAGTNAKMSEYHAAVALATLDSWNEHVARRVELHKAYVARLASSGVALQKRTTHGVYTIMPVLLPGGVSAADVGERLLGEGIETRRWYWPAIHQHPAFGGMPTAGTLQTVSELGKRLLGLPFHPFLQEGDLDLICDRLRAAVAVG